MRHRDTILLYAVLSCVSLAMPVTASATTVVAQQGDAAISHDAGTWTLAAGGASLTLELDPSRDFSIVSLTSAAGTSWAVPAPDTFVRGGSRALAFGSRSAGFTFHTRCSRSTPGSSAPPPARR